MGECFSESRRQGFWQTDFGDGTRRKLILFGFYRWQSMLAVALGGFLLSIIIVFNGKSQIFFFLQTHYN